jgi:hypothetical protein
MLAALGVTVGAMVFIMVLGYFEGMPLYPPSKRFVLACCILGTFYFIGYLAGSKAEREARPIV